MAGFDNMQAEGLTNGRGNRNRAVMTRTPLLLTLVAAAALAGCDTQGQNIVVGPNSGDTEVNQVDVSNVQLPPSIAASHTYRCRDNSLVYVDWLSNDTARIKQDRGEVGTTITKGEDGAYTAEGQSLTGDPSAQSVTINGKTCKR